MKITYAKPINYVPFSDLKLGQCFFDPDGDLCIKTSHGVAFCFNRVGDYNFVESFESIDKPVRPVECELIVHEEKW